MTLNATPIVGGKYALITKLGHGSMADVYLGVSEGLEGFAKLAVVKVLRSHLAQDADFVARFLEEGRIAMRLSHPNVVQTYEVGQDASSYFLAMEFLEGQTLSAVLNRLGRKRGDFGFAYQVVVLTEILAALEYAHELADYDGTPLNVIHRDVSPPNVFITYDGTVKVLDFGIAKALDTSIETKTGLILGKTAYMAPEQALGRDLDRRVDLYAVGVMLWEAAAGKRRWEGMHDAAILRELVSSELVELPTTTVDGCPASVHDILARALAPDPQDRYASAAEFRTDLEEILRDIGVRASSRQLGACVTAAFKADRERIQRSIELQIAKRSAAVTLSTGAELSEDDELPNIDDEQVRRTSVDPVTTGARRIATGATDIRRQSLLAGGAVALALVAAWSAGWLVSARTPDGSAAASKQSESEAPQPVSVRLAADPPAAILYLDDNRLAGNPAVAEYPADGSLHVFRAEAPGYAPDVRVLKITGPADVTLRLRRLPDEAKKETTSDASPPPVAVSRRVKIRTVERVVTVAAPTGAAVVDAADAHATSAREAPAASPRKKVPEVKLDTGNPW